MKIFVRSVLYLVLVSVILVGLVGCGGEGDSAKNFEFSEFNADNLFTNGVTAFKSASGDKMGFIDKNGDYIIKPKFDNAYNFAANGLARVEVNDQWGYINTSGEYVIEPKYGNAYDFDEQGMAHVFYEGRHGFIDIKGNWLIVNKYVNVGEFADNGLATMCLKVDEDFLYGYIDRQGNEVISAQFEECNSFSNGLAAVKRDGKWGFVDGNGNFVIEAKYSLVSDFGKNGLAFARQPDDAGTGYINKTGELVFALDARQTYTGTAFNEFGIARLSVSGRPRLITETGASVTEDFFISIDDFDKNGLAVATKTKGESGYINTKAEFVVKGDFSEYENFVNGYACVKKDGKWGFINSKGEQVVECKYYRVTDFGADGYAVVMIEGEEKNSYKYGIIDTTGAAVVDFK